MAGDDNYLLSNNMKAFTMIVIPKEGQTEAAVQAVVTEAMRAAKYGFTATEYERAKEQYQSRLENRYNEREKISNEELAMQYYRNYLDNEPMPSIEQKYQIMTALVPNLPIDLVNSLIPELITTTGENLVVMNFNQEKDGAVYPTSEGLKNAVDAGLNAEVEAFVDNVKQEPLIAKLPKPGKIKKESTNNTFGYTELELSNGARVILKKTDFKKDEITMSAFQRGGSSLYGEQDLVNTSMMPIATMTSGLGGFSNTELQKALAGKRASVMFSMDDYTDELSGSSTVKDLETMFQLIYLNFTDITKDENSFNRVMGQVETLLKNRDLDPSNVFEDSVEYILNNHSWRNRPVNADMLKMINYDRMLQIAKGRTANAANYTFTFVGSFDDEVIRPLIQQYIASLPGKKGKQSNFVDIATHPVGETITHFTRKSETPKAMAEIYWYDTKTPYSLETQLKANILGQVLSKIYLQKIREDAGAAYSTSALGQTGMAGDRPQTMVLAVCPVNPEFEEMALNILNEEMKNAATTIDATALAEAAEQLLKDYATNAKENYFWTNAILDYLTHGYDGISNYEQIVKAQTPESIAEFARQLLSAGNKVEIVMGPEK
jgi:zinc protease